jgi:cold shock protein
MPTGKIKWFDGMKKYGFIINDQGKDLFLHATNIDSNLPYHLLVEGFEVEYQIAPGNRPGQFQAVKVRRL